MTNEILVDGLPTTNPSDQTYTLTPSPDAVQEFKVLTTPFSAEWGHTGRRSDDPDLEIGHATTYTDLSSTISATGC